jgi:hypothetical protein
MRSFRLGSFGLVAGLAAGGGCGVETAPLWWDGAGGTAARPAGKQDGGAPGAMDGGDAPSDARGDPVVAAPIRSVFVVLMSRQSWSAIGGSASAPYINGQLLPRGAHCEAYTAASQPVVSLPNELWLEAGDDFGLTRNQPPSAMHFGTKAHLVDQLEAAGVSWAAYVEHATAGQCPINDVAPLYRTWHVPFLYFDDVSGNPPAADTKRCVDHVLPIEQLAGDLQKGTVPRYAFVVPDMCNDMHDDCNTGDPVRQGDDWLAATVPAILASKAYGDAGALFVLWDFTPDGSPAGFIALSAGAKAGYASHTPFTASSTVRTLQAIFGVSPPLGGAANAQEMAELFTSFP